ncbi:MFS transporter [Pseudonocardia sulfidoxydans NBRC 16205]|uniref:MFS transporter n=1 Tax=Pseudonocardia sulfidoxydans NBRC 16205 TaxID=1223511 RepID=A0A511DQ90_9PSEU|nr:MFS transporter [Pseudonocardia sulfidoxydans]GEL25914.1 MFS transporter [Pseudonocardia sulfidoxydans NBRC 16205]
MRTGLHSVTFWLLLVATVLAFGGYSLLLPIVPLWVTEGGAGPFGAGVTTGVLMAVTVATQFAVPWLLRRIGHRWVLVVGMVLMGAPAPLLALSSELAPVLAVTTVRGVGFGMVTVAGSALVAELLDPAEHSRGASRFGLAVGLPLLLLLPTGVAVVDWVGFTAVFVGGTIPLLGAALMLVLRIDRHGPVVAVDDPDAATAGIVAAGSGTVPEVPGRRRGELGPLLAMLAGATAQGGLITFLPVTGTAAAATLALFATAAGALVGRFLAGELVARRELGGRLLVPGVLIGAVGMAAEVVAALLTAGAAPLLVAGALLVGFGFGMVQNDSLVQLFAFGGPARYGRASALWNAAFDSGFGVGAVGLGAVAGPFGFAAAYGAGTAFLLLVAPFTRRPARA